MDFVPILGNGLHVCYCIVLFTLAVELCDVLRYKTITAIVSVPGFFGGLETDTNYFPGGKIQRTESVFPKFKHNSRHCLQVSGDL